MRSSDANQLQKSWGAKPCAHPDIISECDDGGGDADRWLCTQCGHLVEFDKWAATHGEQDPRD
jgi:hypothetical protein